MYTKRISSFWIQPQRDFYLTLVAKYVRAWTIIPLSVQWYVAHTGKKIWTAAMWTSLFNRWSSFQQSWKDRFFLPYTLLNCVFFSVFFFVLLCIKSNVYRSFVHLDATKSHKSYLLRATEMEHIDFVFVHRTRKRIVKALYSLIYMFAISRIPSNWKNIQQPSKEWKPKKKFFLYSYVRELGK